MNDVLKLRIIFQLFANLDEHPDVDDDGNELEDVDMCQVFYCLSISRLLGCLVSLDELCIFLRDVKATALEVGVAKAPHVAIFEAVATHPLKGCITNGFSCGFPWNDETDGLGPGQGSLGTSQSVSQQLEIQNGQPVHD